MRRRLLLAVLGILLSAYGIAGCASASSTPVASLPTASRVATATRTSPAPSPTLTLSPAPTATLSPVPLPSFTPTPWPTPTLMTSPTSAPTRLPTPTQTLVPATPSAGEPVDFSLGWQFGSYGHLTDGVVAQHDGQPLSVVASLDRRVYALTGNGQVLWRAHTAGPAYTLALLDGGQIAIGDDAGKVLVLDGRGRRLWQHDLGSRTTALSGDWPGGLLAGGWDERLTFLETRAGGGRVRWQADLAGPVSGIAVISGPSGPNLALAATLDGDFRAFDANGVEQWRSEFGVSVTGLQALGGEDTGLVLVGLQDGQLLALQTGTGEPRLHWQRELGLGGPVWHVADLVGEGEFEIVAGTGGEAPSLTRLSTDGEPVWRIATSAAVNALATVDLDGDGMLDILAGLASGEIQAYDGQGRLRGSINAGLPVWGLHATGEGGALALADVVAWQVSARDGSHGIPWLPPPPLVPLPVQRPPPRAEEGAIALAFLGDVAPGRSIEAQLARYGAALPWQGLGPFLHEADLVLANLEGVLTTQGQPLDKDYLIRAHPRWAQTLVEGGLDLVTLANNHALDFGQRGLDETLATLEAFDIAAVGAAPSDDAHRARRPALFELSGVRVAVLGYAADRWNGSEDVPVTNRVAWALPEVVQTDVSSVREQADLVVVLLHAGTEYVAEPSPDQVAVAHAAVDAGADLVVGHHSHVTQPVEHYGEGLIVYGLGDALFDIPRPAAMQGDLLWVHATEQGLARAELWPFWIEDAIRPRLLDDGTGAPVFEVVYP